MSNHEGTLLAIILDLNIDSWILQTEQSRDSPAQFIECLEGLFGFIGSYIVQNHRNQLLFAVYGAGEPTILFPKCDENIALNLKFHSQQPKNVRRFLFPKIIELMKSDHAVKSSLDSCLSRTLCYILPFCVLYASFTPIINKHADPELEKRILVMNITEQPIHDYMQFMNSVFCYRTACPIDICQLYNKHSPFLKRVAKLSNGLYVKAPSSKSLFGLLSYYFLADAEVRKNIIVPTENIEPMKVTCSCHGKPIQNDIAYVCTVCLSILCSYHDHCPIHQFDSSV